MVSELPLGFQGITEKFVFTNELTCHAN